MLLALPDFYSTLCTILNSSPATIGSFSLSTNTVITQVLTKEKNIKLSSFQITLINHIKRKNKLQSSKSLDGDRKKKIKYNYYKKKDYFKSEC